MVLLSISCKGYYFALPYPFSLINPARYLGEAEDKAKKLLEKLYILAVVKIIDNEEYQYTHNLRILALRCLVIRFHLNITRFSKEDCDEFKEKLSEFLAINTPSDGAFEEELLFLIQSIKPIY